MIQRPAVKRRSPASGLVDRYQKPLLLKSPAHTGRIRLLLDLYPEARFVHIHRNPFDIYRSMLGAFRKLRPWWALQKPPGPAEEEEQVLDRYEQVYRAFTIIAGTPYHH